MLKFCIIALLSVLFLACSGNGNDDSNILHFTGRDETEENFRLRLRQIVIDNPSGMQLICYQVKDISPEKAAEALRSTPNPQATMPKGATPRPGQVAKQSDLERQAQIVQEECKRLPIGS